MIPAVQEQAEALLELKPFRSVGLVRRVTPFIGTGLLAAVLLVDPTLRSYPTDSLAFLFALIALLTAFLLPTASRFSVVVLLQLSLLFALLPTLHGPPTIAVAVFCILIVAAIYILPWDYLPRPWHAATSPLGLVAIFALQMITSSSALLVFPLFIIVILFAALHYTRRELLVTATVATFTLFLPALGHPQATATALLLTVVIWVLILTIHEVITLLRAARATISHLAGPDFKTLFESIPNPYLVLDPALDIIAANDAYLQATMTTRAQILGHPLFEIFPDNPSDPNATGVANLQASLERVRTRRLPDTMAIQRYDIRCPPEAGGGFEVRYWSPKNVPVLGPDNTLAGIIHRVEDVTDFVRLREAEAASKERTQALDQQATEMEVNLFNHATELASLNQSLEAAQKSRNIFFASMNHELRTPLNAILGFTDSLLLRMPGPLTQEQDAQLTTIRASATHLLSLINDLLDFAKLEQDRWVMTLEPVLLSELQATVITTLRPLADAKSLSLSASAPDLLFVTDRRALLQILLNLVSNAIKFTSQGSVTLAITLSESDLLFAVSDTGVGIALANQPQLFAAFERLDAPLTTQEGSGLGLYFSQRLARLLFGEVTVDSAPGQGSTFTLRLPWPAPLAQDASSEIA